MELKQPIHLKKEKPSAIIWKTVSTGFFGGILWSLVGVFFAFFNFTVVSPGSFVISSWLHGEWTDGWLAEMIAVLVLGVLSILIALLYLLVFKKLQGILPGLLFGLGLWGIVFGLILPLCPNMKPLLELDSDTIVTTLCLYLLYGVFIGFTISYDHLDRQQNKK